LLVVAVMVVLLLEVLAFAAAAAAERVALPQMPQELEALITGEFLVEHR